MPRAILILLACLAVAFPSAAGAAQAERALPYQNENATGWKAVVSDYGFAPAFLIAVDKKDQLVSVFERKSPLTKIAEYTCTTGQNEGDKLVEGDLKTPEGVYFVVRHITSGLNFSLYGHEAYPLNYPNPVDRIRKKTGSGIWIHGKGVPLVPYDSNGCVGMQNQDIAVFKQKPMLGQPVTLAVDVEHRADAGSERSATAARLAAMVEGWAKAWSDRSAAFFDFYDPELYAIAQRQSFTAFRAQKERLFKALPWIDTSVSDIQVLEGPGYWVTWFNQDYKAPNLTSSGTRRLYWQADERGELRIVGMEWLKGFKSPLLYAEARPAVRPDVRTDAQPEAPSAAPSAVTPDAPSAEPAGVTEPRPVAEARPAQPAAGDRTEPAREAEPAARQEREARAFIDSWQAAWKARDLAAYARCYKDGAVQDRRRGLESILAHKAKLWSASEVTRLDLGDVALEPTKRGFRAIMRQDYADSRGYADKGVKVLYLEYGPAWRIAREDWTPLVTQ